MARLRAAKCYREIKRPFTRRSKYKEKSYVGSVPQSKISIYEMGNKNLPYTHELTLNSKQALQIRSEALEAARVVANKYLEKFLPQNFFFQIKVYPHQIIREHSLATGAGADRFTSGMSKAFGRNIGVAAQVKEGQEIMILRVNENSIKIGKQALERAAKKLPCKCSINIKKIN
ncbi:MAG: 50S ribosomal protein L16 [Candidatus Parvarchaeota archaeon]|nr:50S ribosomal protein L16 [Candidatus Jingweiarchaeum tengchongense]MCW1298091.1 50S ribosomal protein L16 [Candidatus Jingweiarchaeum tengchongense]MCW1300793.1 50S ribosomal protein L16 [Candidatus Jingweiarchaeum tengchongense]MCW1304927.1 50S ribosomal protein L16 [Candidatus Jingweiarchaeum tengchongense]MCW1305513.1 50S ribosomal protein L16 [Candidatus Jingweiarchaeum tengchongense]